MGDQQEGWLIRSRDGTTAGPFTIGDLAMLVAQRKLDLKQLTRPEDGGKTCRVGDVVSEEDLEQAAARIATASETAKRVRGERLVEIGRARAQCPECGRAFRAVAGVCKHCGAQHVHLSDYELGSMCPFVVASVGGGGGIRGMSYESYTWQHLECMGAYCMMWDVRSEQCKIAGAAESLIERATSSSSED